MRLVPFTSIALVCALALAAEARADDVTFTGFAHDSEAVTYTVGALHGTVSAGGFSTILNTGSSFETYCVDLAHTIAFGQTYSYSAPGTSHIFANGNAYHDLGRLYALAGPVNTSVLEAAFQMAVWEIAYETTGSYGLGGGAATFSGGIDATNQAATWLAAVILPGSVTPINVLDSLQDRNGQWHQSVIYPPVPEPETYALLMAGLAAVGFVARRRKERRLSAR
jgi:hypothetical protein